MAVHQPVDSIGVAGVLMWYELSSPPVLATLLPRTLFLSPSQPHQLLDESTLPH